MGRMLKITGRFYGRLPFFTKDKEEKDIPAKQKPFNVSTYGQNKNIALITLVGRLLTVTAITFKLTVILFLKKHY